MLNGHIHQKVQKVEGPITFHTRSQAPPPAPGRLKVPAEQLPPRLGLTDVSVLAQPRSPAPHDKTLV